jgi:hypothetical protein
MTLIVGPRLAGGLNVHLAAGIARAAQDPAHRIALEARRLQNVPVAEALAAHGALAAKEALSPLQAVTLDAFERLLKGRGWILPPVVSRLHPRRPALAVA